MKNSSKKLASATIASFTLILVGCEDKPLPTPSPCTSASAAPAPPCTAAAPNTTAAPTTSVEGTGGGAGGTTGSGNGIIFGSCADGCTQTALRNALGGADAACLVADTHC